MNKFKVGDKVVSTCGGGEIIKVDYGKGVAFVDFFWISNPLWISMSGLFPEDKFFAALDEFHKEDENEQY